MAMLRLSQRRVDTLKPRKSAYDVRDRELKGFGVRVLPSGNKHLTARAGHAIDLSRIDRAAWLDGLWPVQRGRPRRQLAAPLHQPSHASRLSNNPETAPSITAPTLTPHLTSSQGHPTPALQLFRLSQ